MFHTYVHTHTASTKTSHSPPQDWSQNPGLRCPGKTLGAISGGCPSKVPQIGWLKTTEATSLTVLEAGSLTSRCQQVGSFRSSEGDPAPGSLPAWVAPAMSGVPWLVATSLQQLPHLHRTLSVSPLSTSPFPFSFEDTGHWIKSSP